MSIVIELSADEMLSGVIVAAQRKISSDRRRANGNAARRAEHYEEQRTWDQEIESAFAEIAAARWRNRYWSGSHFNGSNAGSDAGAAQVRWTEHEDGHLILYPEDDPVSHYILVVGRSPRLRIVGYLRGGEGMQDVDWRERGHGAKADSWWVPQHKLKSVHA